MGCHFFSRGSSQPRNRTQVSCTARQILYPLSHQGSPSWCIDWLQSHDYKLEGTNNLQSERFQTHEMKLIRISFFVNIYAYTHTHTHRASPVIQCKEFAYNAGDMDSIPGLGRSLGEGNGNPLQYPCLENPMDRGTWQTILHGVAKGSDVT